MALQMVPWTPPMMPTIPPQPQVLRTVLPTMPTALETTWAALSNSFDQMRATYMSLMSVRLLVYLCGWGLTVVFYLPVIVLYLFLLYALICIAHVAHNPRLLVTGFFATLDFGPVYGSWALGEIKAQLWEELQSRLR